MSLPTLVLLRTSDVSVFGQPLVGWWNASERQIESVEIIHAVVRHSVSIVHAVVRHSVEIIGAVVRHSVEIIHADIAYGLVRHGGRTPSRTRDGRGERFVQRVRGSESHAVTFNPKNSVVELNGKTSKKKIIPYHS